MAASTFSVAFAAPITGQLSIAGDVTLTSSTAAFICDTGTATPCLSNSGNFVVTGPSAQSGSFTSLANTGGFITSLNNLTTTPINMAFSLPSFITFASNPDIVLNLSFIPSGTGGACPPAAGAVCTPRTGALVTPSNPNGISIYNYADTALGSNIAFSVGGTATRVSTGEVTPLNGTFSLTFTSTPGTSDHSAASELGKSSVTASYVGVFQTTPGSPDTGVPEPASIGLIGAGLVAAGVLRRYSKRS